MIMGQGSRARFPGGMRGNGGWGYQLAARQVRPDDGESAWVETEFGPGVHTADPAAKSRERWHLKA